MKVTQKYNINGMACAMCAGNVKNALSQAAGVESVKVNLADKNATITFDDTATTPEKLQSVIKEAGYEMVL